VPFILLLIVPLSAALVILYVSSHAVSSSSPNLPLRKQQDGPAAARNVLTMPIEHLPTVSPTLPTGEAAGKQKDPLFPYSLSSNVDLRAYLVPPLDPKPCELEYTTHRLSASLTCETKTLPGAGMLCYGKRIVFDPSHVRMSKGGEDVAQVMGRTDEAEQALILPGAFSFAPGSPPCQLDGFPMFIARSTPWATGTLQSLCGPSHPAPPAGACTSASDFGSPRLTIVVQRFEYVNLYHTATELASAVNSFLRAEKTRRNQAGAEATTVLSEPGVGPVRVLFLDGHAKGNLDELWAGVFGPGATVVRAGTLTGPLCLDEVVFAEIGYSSHINIHPIDNGLNALTGKPGNRCVFAPALTLSGAVARMTNTLNARRVNKKAVFIMRDHPSKPAHPRMNIHHLERSMGNARELQARADYLRKERGLDISLAYLSELPFAEQVELIKSCDVVISVHGAALTHLIWADPDTLFVELSPSSYGQRMHFVKMALTKGQRYARLGPGSDATFLSGSTGVIHLSPDMFQSIVEWSLLPSDEARVRVFGRGGWL
jgi:hypothetical protein